jgi:hypothetical protein
VEISGEGRVFLDAIQAVETGCGGSHPRALGKYQVTRPVWEQHRDPAKPWMDWLYAVNHKDWKDVRDETDEIVARHLSWLVSRLKHHGKPVNPYTLSLCWRVGLKSYLDRSYGKRHENYAHRVEALYWDDYPEAVATNGGGYVFEPVVEIK